MITISIDLSGEMQKQILAKLEQLLKGQQMAAATLDDLVTETARQTTIEASTEAFIAGLEAQILAAGGNAAKIQQIFDSLKANNDKLAFALGSVSGPPPTPVTGP